jgi:uncharacterized protein YdaT
MTKRFVHTVYRKDEGIWANEVEGGERASSRHEIKSAAVERGRELAMAAHTEHVIHNQDGTISERNSYGNDPYPPAG